MNSTQINATFGRYRRAIHDLIDAPKEGNRSDSEIWQLTCQWYQDKGGRELFMQAFEDVTGIKLNVKTSPDQRIGAALPKSLRDYENKLKDKAYYRALGELFIEEMDSMVKRVPRKSEDPATTFSYGNLVRFVKHILLDSLYLFQEWGMFISKLPSHLQNSNSTSSVKLTDFDNWQFLALIRHRGACGASPRSPSGDDEASWSVNGRTSPVHPRRESAAPVTTGWDQVGFRPVAVPTVPPSAQECRASGGTKPWRDHARVPDDRQSRP